MRSADFSWPSAAESFACGRGTRGVKVAKGIQMMTTISRSVVVVGLILRVLLGGMACGQKLATEVTTPGHPFHGGGSFLGWEFTVSTPVEVTALGQWDRDGNGLSNPATIALFDKDTEVLLRTATVEAGQGPTLENQFRLADLDEPLPLQPGKSYLIASNVGDTVFRTDGFGGVSSEITSAPEVEILRWWFESGSEVRFPTRPEGPTQPRWVGQAYLGPNFKFTGGGPPVRPQVQSWEFSGMLKLVELDGDATFAGSRVNDLMQGQVIIPGSNRDANFVPPETYAFPSHSYSLEMSGGEVTAGTAGSIRPLEISFYDNLVLAADELELINECLGLNLPAGTRVDLAEIESERTIGDRRLEMGLSFVSLDLNLFDGSAYRTFPSLEEVDFAVYFLLEEESGEEIFNALGVITGFRRVDHSIRISQISLEGNTMVVDFSAAPDLGDWRIMGSADPAAGFPDLLPAVVTEDPEVTGKYRAEMEVGDRGASYFVRVER